MKSNFAAVRDALTRKPYEGNRNGTDVTNFALTVAKQS